MSLELLLIIAFGGAFLTYFLGKISSILRNISAVLVSLALVVFVSCLYNIKIEKIFYDCFLGLPLAFKLNSLSWFFAIATVSLTFLSVIYSLDYMKDSKRTDYYYFIMLLINAGMLGIILSGDFSFFLYILGNYELVNYFY